MVLTVPPGALPLASAWTDPEGDGELWPVVAVALEPACKASALHQELMHLKTRVQHTTSRV